MEDDAPKAALTILRESRLLRILSWIAAAIAVPAFLVSLPPVQGWLFKSRPEVQVALMSQVPVFDVRRPIPGLTVMYNNDDLTASNRALMSSRLRIQNTGAASLTPADLTERDPLGFTVYGGDILRITRVTSNSDHLQRLVSPSRHGNAISLNGGLIFDPIDYVDIDIIILKPSRSSLSYIPMGKVSRQTAIPFVDRTAQPDPRNLFERAFSGSILEQILRLVGYFIVAVGLIVLVVFIGTKLSLARDRRLEIKREKIAISVLEKLSDRNPAAVAVALGLFVALGQKMFSELLDVPKKNFELSSRLGPASKDAKYIGDTIRADRRAVTKYVKDHDYRGKNGVLRLLREFGLIDGKEVSSQFIEIMEQVDKAAREARAERLGTGLSRYGVSTFAKGQNGDV